MRVAYYSPLPPSRSGIADYSALLLPELEKRVDVVVARPGRFRRDPAGDVALYHVGNAPEAHAWIVEALRRRPGVVVLHELVLHHLVSGITLARGDAEGYVRAMEREAGLVGRLLATAVIEGRIPPLWETRPQDFPLAAEVLSLATMLVVHSRYAEERARAAGFEGPIRRIPMAAWPVVDAPSAHVDGSPVFGCFGNLNDSKRVPQLLAAFDELRARRPDARLLLVGGSSKSVAALTLPDGVLREEYVPEERLWSLMRACDAHVCLRWPTMGETSAVVVRALSLGMPLVVSDVGAFAELPDEVALKIPVSEGEVDALVAALDLLAGDDHRRRTMSDAALALAASEHALEHVADLYVDALAAARQPVAA